MIELARDLFKRFDIDSLDNREPELIAALSRAASEPLRRYFDADVRGIERIPEGAALYVGNHNGGLLTIDSFIAGTAICEARGPEFVPYGLGHEVAISLPVIHPLLVRLGAVRASHENALRLFDRGAKVLVYPGGDYDAMRPFSQRDRVVFGGRKGYMRLALRAGVPVVPIVAAGAHATFLIVDDMRWLARALRLDKLLRIKVWPLTLSLPWGLTLGPPPPYFPLPTRILIEALEPITFSRTGEEAAADDDWVAECAERVESKMQEALTRLADERREDGRTGFLERVLAS